MFSVMSSISTTLGSVANLEKMIHSTSLTVWTIGKKKKDSVVGVLKAPIAGATKRLKKIVKLPVPLQGYNLR